jgi:hypothetical protein
LIFSIGNLQGDVLFESRGSYIIDEFKYTNLNSIAFFQFSGNVIKIDLAKIIKDLTDNRISIETRKTTDMQMLLSSMYVFIELTKQEDFYRLAVDANIYATTKTGIEGRIPVFYRSYIFSNQQNIYQEMERYLHKGLKEFMDKYLSDNLDHLPEIVFYMNQW